jgi:acetylornithine aminotransferase
VDAVLEELGDRADLTPRAYEQILKQVARLRGRPLLFPTFAAGLGRGARMTLADGRVLLDFVGGIGVQGLGHGDRDLLETAVAAAAGDLVFQGHLTPGPEYLHLSRSLLRHAGGRLKHAWLSVAGATANENALKMIYQRRHPADRLLAFEGNFAGRTLAMA